MNSMYQQIVTITKDANGKLGCLESLTTVIMSQPRTTMIMSQPRTTVITDFCLRLDDDLAVEA